MFVRVRCRVNVEARRVCGSFVNRRFCGDLSKISDRFRQKPGAAFGFVDPDFNQAGRGAVAVFVANFVRFPQRTGEVLIVVAQFAQHVVGVTNSSLLSFNR